MKCILCGGRLREKFVDMPFTYKGYLVLIKGLRAYACEQRGDIYLPPSSDEVIRRVLDKIDADKLVPKQMEVVVEAAV